MALFAQYAMAASQEALDDAEWHPESPEDFEATVGITCTCTQAMLTRHRECIWALV